MDPDADMDQLQVFGGGLMSSQTGSGFQATWRPETKKAAQRRGVLCFGKQELHSEHKHANLTDAGVNLQHQFTKLFKNVL